MTYFVLFVALLIALAQSQQVCTPDLSNPSSECNNKGYCIAGEVNNASTGCSCLSGYDGIDCDTSAPNRTSCLADVSGVQSRFVTELGGMMDSNGNIVLTVDVESLEESIGDVENSTNYATYTTHRFLNQDQCDYPEGDLTSWGKTFEQCGETYNSVTALSDLLDCMGKDFTECIDSNNQVVDDCVPESCDNPPCRVCYSGQVLSTRRYLRTSVSGSLTAQSTAENCHYFEICLPWIAEIEKSIFVEDIPDFAKEFVLTRVAFECFRDLSTCEDINDESFKWEVEIQTAANYPFYVEETGPNSGRLSSSAGDFDLDSLTSSPNCGVEGLCEQTLTFLVPGCNSLEEEAVYELLGLAYNCAENDTDCTDAKANFAGSFEVNASVTIQATQDNCGANFVIDASDSLTLQIDSYSDFSFSDLTTVFSQKEDLLSTAFFKVEATSTAPLTSFAIRNEQVEVELNGNTQNLPVDPTDCGDSSVDTVCFSLDVDALIPDADLLATVTVRVTLLAGFENQKRSVGLSDVQTASRDIKVIFEDKQTSEDSAPAFIMPFVALFFGLFI